MANLEHLILKRASIASNNVLQYPVSNFLKPLDLEKPCQFQFRLQCCLEAGARFRTRLRFAGEPAGKGAEL